MKTNLRSMIDDALDGNMAREQQHGYHSPESTYDASVSDDGVYKLAQALNYVSANLNDLGTTDEKLAELALLQEKLADATTATADAAKDAATDTFGAGWTALKDQGLGKAWEGLSTGRKWVAGAGAGALGLGALYGGYKLLSGGDSGNRTTVIKNASLSGLDQARARAIVNLAEKYGMSQFEYFDKIAASAQFLQALGADDTGNIVSNKGIGSKPMPTITAPGTAGGEYTLGSQKFKTEDEAKRALEAMKARRAKDVQRMFPQQNLLTADSQKLLTDYAGGASLDDAARTQLLAEVKGNTAIAMSGDKAGIGTAARAPTAKEVKLPGSGNTVYVSPTARMKGDKLVSSLNPAELESALTAAGSRGLAGVSTTAPTSQFENALSARGEQATTLSARSTKRKALSDAAAANVTAGEPKKQVLAGLNRRSDASLADLAKKRGVTVPAGTDRATLMNLLADDIAGKADQARNIAARGGKAVRIRAAALDRVLKNSGKDVKLPGTVIALIKAGRPVDASSFSSVAGLNATQKEALAANINAEIEKALRLEGRAATSPGRRAGQGSKPVPNEKSLSTQGRNTPGASRGTSTTAKATEKATEGFFARNRGLLYGGGAAAAAGLAGYGLYRAMRGGRGYEPSREPAQPSYDSGGYGEYKSASLRKLAEDRISPARIVAGKADPFSGFDIHGQPCDPPMIENPVALRAQAVRAMINGSMTNYVSNTGDGYDLSRYLGHFNK